MHLRAPLIRLPLRVDAARLAAEIERVDEQRWRPHPQGMPGNDALILVSAGGDPEDDATKGRMAPTPILADLPYVRSVMGALESTIGRSRLMRLDAAAEAQPHVDINHYWLERMRVHVPVVTDPSVEFIVADQSVHMAPGEVWVFDTWSLHTVKNPSGVKRVHLVIDTVGSARLWDLVDRPDQPVVQVAQDDPALRFEQVNRAPVMSPWEMEDLLERLLTGVVPEAARAVRPVLRSLVHDWRDNWAASGDGPAALPQYEALLDTARRALAPTAGAWALPNGLDLSTTVAGSILDAATDRRATTTPRARRPIGTGPATPSTAIQAPVIIVSPPRSGSTLLYETLAGSPDLFSIGLESHEVIEGIEGLHPRRRGWTSNVLGAADATPDVVAAIHQRFLDRAVDRDGAPPAAGERVRLLEKTPKNSLRIPFLASVFPDARFVLLYRDPLDAIASMLAGWRSGRFVTYPGLPGWQGPKYSFTLVPGWRDLIGRPLATVVAEQWKRTMDVLLDDLSALPSEQWLVTGYGPLIRDPQTEIARLCRALGLRWDRPLEAPLPLSSTTLTPPSTDKREEVADELASISKLVGETAERAREVFAHPPGPSRRRSGSHLVVAGTGAGPAGDQEPAPAGAAEVLTGAGFASEATNTFIELLTSSASSVLVSTYQSRRLIVLRALDGSINTHFLAFESPMGIAARGPDLALAAGRTIWRFRDRPAALDQLEPAGQFDACYVPRSAHITGDLRSHDLAYGTEGLWVVATLFSCLATLDDEHSFVPRWRPSFVSALAAEDRCHLNGLAMRDGVPTFVTCFGASDVAGGWRQDGGATRNGMVLDVATSEPVATGLCMPHSPRWHDGRLWILESGKGELNVVDPSDGSVEVVAKLPGFTRGLSFVGPYALVGLSMVRETVFDGVPIKDGERSCGVWAVDTRSGRIVGWLRFSGSVQEIYDVQVLRGRRCPTVLEPEDGVTARSFVVPDEALASVAR